MTKTVEQRRKDLAARSDDKKVIRSRARKRHEKMLEELETDIEKFYGKPVSEWDFEELQVGRPRDASGELKVHTGPPPAWITPAIMAEAQKRLKLMTRDRLGHHAGAAIEVMAMLMKGARSELVKFNAAKYILDQIVGMPTQRIDLNEGPTPAEFMADFLIELDGRRHPVIEGQVQNNFDEDDEDEDDDG